MPSSDSWKQAYMLRADRLVSDIGRGSDSPDLITAADIANADFRKKLKASPVSLRQPDYQGPEQKAGDELDKRIEAGGFDGFLAQTEKVANTPVIKEALNVLSTGGYATANIADNILDGARNLRDGNLRGISDIAMAAPTGIAQGINAGIAQSEEDATTWGEVIKHGTQDLGMDAENDAAKWVQGIGGFAGDVLLDPTTYLTVGATAAVKGAVVGAKEASKGAKSLAEEMLKTGVKAEDDVFREGGVKGRDSTVQEVADNKNGRLSNAVLKGIAYEKDWREALKARKAQRKAMKSDTSEITDLEDEFVGVDVKAFDDSVKANEEAVNAPAVAKLQETIADDMSFDAPKAADVTEQLPVADEAITEPIPVAEESWPEFEKAKADLAAAGTPSMEQVMDEIINDNTPAPVAKAEEPVVESTAINELDEAVKNEPLVKAAEPSADVKRFEEMGKKLEMFQPKFQTKQYRNRELIKALMEPEKLIQKIPDGDPIRVPNGNKIKNRDFISLNAEGKDAKRQQKVKKDAKATIIDKDYTTGPQQNEPAYNPFIDEDGENLVLNNETFDNLVDAEKVKAFLAENPDHMLEVPIKGGGVVKTPFSKFMNDMENASPESIDKVLNSNVHFFAKLGNDDVVFDLDEVMADYANDFKAFHGEDGLKAAPSVGELPDEIAQVLEDDFVLEQLFKEIEVDNPNKWNSDLAKAFKVLKEEHRELSAQEILGMMRPMTDAEIKKFILKEEDALNVGELRILQEFTGKKSRQDVAEEFIKMKKEYDTWKKGQKKTAEAKAKQPTREDTINKIIDSHPVKPTEENIAQAQLDATEAAEAVVSHPDALNEAVQQSHRVEEFHQAIRDAGNLEPKLLEEFARGAKLREEILNDPTRVITAGAQLVKNAAHNGVKRSMEVQFKDAPFRTGKENMRTMTQDKETGGGWKPERWGSNSQIALYDSILNETLRILPRNNGPYDAVKRRRFFMASMKIADRELRAMGVEPFLNQVDTAGKFVVNLSIYDIFKSIEEVDGGALQRLLFGGQRNAHTLTQIQGAVESMIKLRAKGVSEEKVIRSIRSNLLNSQKLNGRPVRNDDASVGVRNPKTGVAEGALTDSGVRQPLGTGATRAKLDAAIKSGVPAEKAIIEQGRNVNDLAQVIADPRVYQKLNYNMLVNHAAHASKLGEEISELSEETIELMVEMSKFNGPGAVLKQFTEIRDGLTKQFNKADFETARLGFDAKMASLITESERYVIDTANKRSKIAAIPKAKAADVKKDDVPDILPNGKPTHTENHKKPAVDEPKQDIVNASHAEDAKHAEVTAAKVIEEAKTVPENVIVEDVVDQTVDLMAASITTAAYRKLHPIQKLTNPALGLSENTLRAIQTGSHSIARQQAHFHETLDRHLRKYTPEQLASDFKRLQELGRDASRRANGAILVGGESDSLRELYGIIGTMFEVSAKSVFARNVVGARHFNKLAQANGLPEMWRFDPDKNAVENGHLWTEWTEIEEKGIQDFLSRMHSITVKASQEIAIAADFSMRFGQKTPGEGLVKIKWTNQKEKNASFYDLIDKNLYYPRDIAGQIITMDRLMAESRSVSLKNPFGRFIVNVFDPITNALKASQTTVRPGHWVISVIGDLMRNQIAGVNSVQPYRHAVEIMKAGKMDTSFIGKIDSAEALAKYRKSQEIATGFMATGKGKGATLHIGGKKVNVSYDTLYRLMNDAIMLPKHRGGGGVLEDRFVGEQVTNKVARGLEKATDFVTDNSKFSLNDLAAKRDNFMRISLAIDFASKRQWKNLREMKAAMEGQVVKWAPTSTDMTLFEAKYARRTMLYYTWLRGITPRMIDAAMTKPGVVTMVPKALYNVALANGLNPESIGNPFPEDDGLFPSYYYNNVLGPQWKDEFGMWGINPSSPVIEVANTFSRIKPGDPVGNVLNTGAQLTGMATPFVRMPIEGSMQTQSNGIPIEDGNQYLLDNLGGSWIGAASRASGKTLNPDGIVDRTDSAAKATPEEQAEHAQLQLFNFLTGLKLTDYKSESAKRAAYYDQKEELNAEADMLRRLQ